MIDFGAEKINIPDGVILNTYRFTLLNKDNEIIDEQVFHNKSDWKNYLRSSTTNLSLRLGTFTASDAARYQTNGYWNKGYGCIVDTFKGGMTTYSDTLLKVGGDGVQFYPNMDKQGFSLFGTEIFSSSLDWVCDGIFNGMGDEFPQIHYVGSTTWGYHSDSSPYNQEVNGKFGILIYDGGLYTRSEGMFTHFKSNMVKAPTDILKISIQIIFMSISTSYGGSFIAPCMNAAFGHSLNNDNYGLSSFYPSSFGVSVYPSYATANSSDSDGDYKFKGQIPPLSSTTIFSLNSHDPYDSWLPTDSPDLDHWNHDEKGKWYGFPLYRYVGEGEVYQKQTKILKDGTTTEEYVYNSKGQRTIRLNSLDPAIVRKYNSQNIGKINSQVFDGFTVRNFNLCPTNEGSHKVGYIKIGTGDGTTTRFYHPFSTSDGTIDGAYYLKGSQTGYANNITYYNNSQNVFCSHPNFKYFENGIEIFDSSQRDRVSDLNYDPQKKKTTFGLHPFDYHYYPKAGLLGRNGIVVHDFGSSGTVIRSGWNGMTRDEWWNGNLYIITSDNLEDVANGNGRSITIPSYPYQHAQSNYNFECDRYVGFYGDQYWVLGSTYVGGMSYNGYEPHAVRISTNEEIDGYVEFDTAPPYGSIIYIDVDFNTNFIGNFSEISALGYFVMGEEGNNGN